MCGYTETTSCLSVTLSMSNGFLLKLQEFWIVTNGGILGPSGLMMMALGSISGDSKKDQKKFKKGERVKETRKQEETKKKNTWTDDEQKVEIKR